IRRHRRDHVSRRVPFPATRDLPPAAWAAIRRHRGLRGGQLHVRELPDHLHGLSVAIWSVGGRDPHVLARGDGLRTGVARRDRSSYTRDMTLKRRQGHPAEAAIRQAGGVPTPVFLFSLPRSG